MSDPATIPSASVLSPAGEGNRINTFRAVEGHAETVPGGALLIAAYAVVWLVLLAVVARIFLRQTAVARELDALRARIDRSKATSSASGARGGGAA